MIEAIETHLGRWMQEHTTGFTRRALGLIFLWFGMLKFCPGLCDVELLAARTMTLLTFHIFTPQSCIRLLALWECVMGAVLLFAPSNKRWGLAALKLCVLGLLAHLAGTFLPMVLFPAETWKTFPFAPTLAGQYILKNVVLAAAACAVGANLSRQPVRLQVLPFRGKTQQRSA